MLAIEHDPAEQGSANGVPGCFVWDIAQLAAGQLDVERSLVSLGEAWIGSVSVNRTALHQVRTDAGWGVVLLPAPESDAVYFEGRRLLAGDSVLLPPDSHLELLTHAAGRIHLIAFRGACAGSRVRLRRPRWYANADGRAGSGFPGDVGALLAKWNSAAGDSFSDYRIAGAAPGVAAVGDGGCRAIPTPKSLRCRDAGWRSNAFAASSTHISPNR